MPVSQHAAQAIEAVTRDPALYGAGGDYVELQTIVCVDCNACSGPAERVTGKSGTAADQWQADHHGDTAHTNYRLLTLSSSRLTVRRTTR